MHAYSIDTNERKIVTGLIGAISFILSYFFYKKLNYWDISLPGYVDGLSTLVVFGLMYYFFDVHLWKCSFLKKTNLVKTPDFNGEWKGKYLSSYRKQDSDEVYQGEVILSIEQTWTKIRIISKNEKSKSCSEIAGIFVNDNMGIVLKQQYKNEAGYDSEETMGLHYGFSKLTYYPDSQKLEGEYFNDRNRQTYGTVTYIKNDFLQSLDSSEN